MTNIRHCHVLITSPSINVEQNIGGISNNTKLLIENNQQVEYIHFVRGKKDFKKRSFSWLMRQPVFLYRFVYTLVINKRLKIVHINMPMSRLSIIRDTLLILISSCLSKKVITHFRGGEYTQNENIPLLLKWLMSLSLLLSDRIITLGTKEKMFFIDYYKIKFNKIVSIPNAVRIPNPPPVKPQSTKIIILFLGRIDKNKGLKEIVDTLNILKESIDFKFYIAGDGADKKDFLKECKSRIPDKYEYLGVLSGKEKELVLAKSHIFLLPSYFEGLPCSLLEAMAYKLVPIVTPVGSIPEIVENNKNGFLVPVNNHQAIYRCIIELYKNLDLMQELSNNAYNTIKSQYSLDEYILKINSIYSDLL